MIKAFRITLGIGLGIIFCYALYLTAIYALAYWLIS